MKRVAILLIAILIPGCAIYQQTPGIHAVERDYGYRFGERENVSRIESAENPGLYREINYSEPYTYNTNVVPLIKGVDFGFRFEVVGLNAANSKDMLFVIQHPEMLRADGKKSDRYSGTRLLEYDPEWGYYYDWSYALSEDFEVIPGRWVIEVFYRDKLLIKKTFNVVREYSNRLLQPNAKASAE